MSEQIGNAGKPRLLAFIIDNLFATILSFLVVALLQPGNNVIAGSTVCVAYLLYYFVFEALWSRTPGKYFQGLEIRKSDGSKCSTAAAAIRTLARIFEVNPLLVGVCPRLSRSFRRDESSVSAA